MADTIESTEVYKVLARALKREGVKHIFSAAALDLDCANSFLEEGVVLVSCSNPLNAAFAADSYSRFSGIGLVILDGGLDCLDGSFDDNIPLVCLLVGEEEVTPRPPLRFV